MLTTQSVRHHDADLARVHSLPKSRGEETDTEDEDVAEDVEADTEPPLDCDRHVVRSVLEVQALLGLDHEPMLHKGMSGPPSAKGNTGNTMLTWERYARTVLRPVSVSDGQGTIRTLPYGRRELASHSPE